MSGLDFLSPGRCAPETLVSPLSRALAGAPEGVRDLSDDGKVEIRGDLASSRSPRARSSSAHAATRPAADGRPARRPSRRAREGGLRAYDMTGALAGLAFEGETLFRRLTDLDPGALPTAGGFARVSAVLVRDEGERFRAYFPQEVGHYVAEVVLDMLAGVENE